MKTEIEVVEDGKGAFNITMTYEAIGARGRIPLQCGLSFREAAFFADGVQRGFIEARNAIVRQANFVREPTVVLPERSVDDGST